MKSLLKSLAVVASAVSTFSACSEEDKCKDIICGEFGTCNEGICDCLPNYEKDADGLCSVLERAKFTGNYNVTTSCGRDYSASISNGTELNEIKFNSLVADGNGTVLVGIVSGNTVTIARTRDLDESMFFFYEGEGKIENGVLTINLIGTEEEIVIDADGNETYEVIDTYNCEYTLTK